MSVSTTQQAGQLRQACQAGDLESCALGTLLDHYCVTLDSHQTYILDA